MAWALLFDLERFFVAAAQALKLTHIGSRLRNRNHIHSALQADRMGNSGSTSLMNKVSALVAILGAILKWYLLCLLKRRLGFLVLPSLDGINTVGEQLALQASPPTSLGEAEGVDRTDPIFRASGFPLVLEYQNQTNRLYKGRFE
jgi:hypothetical protein